MKQIQQRETLDIYECPKCGKIKSVPRGCDEPECECEEESWDCFDKESQGFDVPDEFDW